MPFHRGGRCCPAATRAALGREYIDGERVFWDVHDQAEAVVIERLFHVWLGMLALGNLPSYLMTGPFRNLGDISSALGYAHAPGVGRRTRPAVCGHWACSRGCSAR